MAGDEKPRVPKLYQNPVPQGAVTTERGPGGAEVKVTTVNGKKVKFIDSYWTFTIATFCVGPVALPLFWRNPRASRNSKIVVTILVAIWTVVLIWVNVKGGQWAKRKYDEAVQMQKMLQEGAVQ